MAKEISKTLIVGLGGTGQKVIRDIKKRLLRTYGEIPPLVKFLEFDTDDKEKQDTPFQYYYAGVTNEDYKYDIDNSEFLKIPSPGMDVVERDRVCNQKLNMDELKNVSHRLSGKGAGGYRVYGRAHFLNASKSIIGVLRNTISNLKSAGLSAAQMAKGYNVSNEEITVYVIASLAGGTGSSAFLDMSRMLQIANVNVNYSVVQGSLDRIFGVFFLPRFFEGKPNTDNVNINTYTALSELDYTFDLANPRHAPGSREINNDSQDYHGSTNNGKRVIYDGIYLVDSLTSKGQTLKLEEATNYVASFIASSIAADAAALTSSYVNSNHKMKTVNGKYQNYSGLGYCELRFNRQELVRYLLNRKLIGVIEKFKSGDNGVYASQIAQSFIDENKLNEGVIKNGQGEDTRSQQNELTDAIIDMSDRRLTSLTMTSVDTGDEAADNVDVSKAKYLSAINTAAQEMVRGFGARKDELLKSFKNMLDERETGNGFGVFPDLARCMRTLLGEMKKGLECELQKEDELFNKIENQELPLLKSSIVENSSGGVLWGLFGNKHDEQEVAIQGYFNKVLFTVGSAAKPTLAWLRVDTARKTEAVAVYEKMIEILDGYYKEETQQTVNGPITTVKGTFRAVDGMYKVLIDALLRENSSYKPSEAAVNETVFADAYFKQYFEEHEDDTMALNPQSKNALETYISKLFEERPTVDEEKLAEMRKELLGLLPANGLVRQVESSDMSFDDLFIHCYGDYGKIKKKTDLEANPQLKLLGQVNTLFDTLWRYVNFRGEGLEPSKNLVVGVYDTQNNIFSPQHGYQSSLDGWTTSDYCYIGLGDPDRIAFMLLETAIPAYKLMGVDSWANEFNQNRDSVYTFSDKRMENIELIMPGAHNDAEIAWAYGWLFGFITNYKNKNAMRVKPSFAYKTDKNVNFESNGDYNYFATLTKKKDIYACHQKFINDQDLSTDIYNRALEVIEKDPVGSIVKLKEWVNDKKMWGDVRGKERNAMTEDEIAVIENEVKYLAMLFDYFGSAYGLSLDSDGNIVHIESEAVKAKEEEAKAKKNKSADSKE